MIPFLSPFILRLLGDRFKWAADLIAIVLLIASVWGAWSLWLHFHDKGVVAEHEAMVQADVIEVTDNAEDAADASAAAAAARFTAKQDQDRKEIENAKVTGNSPFDSWNAQRAPVSGGVQQPARADRKATD